MSTVETITPALESVYGKSDITEALASRLAFCIDEGKWDDRGREHKLREVCWLWFSGGGAAAMAAKRVEKALALHWLDPQQEEGE